MRGHYAYYGIAGNLRRLRWYATIGPKDLAEMVVAEGKPVALDPFNTLLTRHPLPAAQIIHRYTTVSKALP